MTDPVTDATVSATTAEAVAAWLQLPAEDAGQLDGTVAAVNALVLRWKGAVPADGWGDDVVQGATMLATRLWRRRNSPGGVEVFGAEGAAYVQRTDPDVAMLLGLGTYSPPVVG